MYPNSLFPLLYIHFKELPYYLLAILSFVVVGGGPSPSDVSELSQKVCSIIGEDSPTLAGIEGGVDVDDEDDLAMENEFPVSSKKPRCV